MQDPGSPHQPTDPIPRITFAGLSFAGLASMMGRGILLPILPNFARDLGATGSVVGLIFAGFAFSRGLSSPMLGRISDRYGRKKMMLIGLVLYALLSLGYSFVQHLWLLALVWFLQGLTSAMVAPIAQSYVGDITPTGQEGRVMNLYYFVQFGGAAVGPVLGGYLADHVSRDAPFYAMGAVALTSLGMVALFVPKMSQARRDKAGGLTFGESMKAVLRDYKMRGVLSYLFGRGFYRRGFNAFFPIYAVSIAALSQSQVGIILSSYMTTGILLQYPFGRLSDRWAKKRPELVGIGGLVAGLTMFAFPSLTMLSWLMVVVVIKGIFSTFSRAPMVAIRTERGRIHGMGAVTGMSVMAMSAGQVVGPIGFGAASDLFSIPASFYFGGLISLVTVGAAYYYLRCRTGHKEEAITE